MELSGEKSDAAAPGLPAHPRWSVKESNERSEWFLIAGFIAAVGFGIIGIGVYGLMYWVSPGPDRLVDIFVCSMAILLGIFFLIVTAAGLSWLNRQRPTNIAAAAPAGNSHVA